MEGFAKLVGCVNSQDDHSKNATKLITRLPATIGRTTTAQMDEDGEQISIGPTEPTLSRYHGTISWNPISSNFEITCKSKNGMVVDKKVYKKNEIAPLSIKSSLRLGSVRLSFIPANSSGTSGIYISPYILQRISLSFTISGRKI